MLDADQPQAYKGSMAKSTHPITYRYLFQNEGTAYVIEVTRRHVGTAYPKNGNVGNPTEYFLWDVKVDGEIAIVGCPNRTDAYEHGRAKALGIRYYNSDRPGRSINVRFFRAVAEEMKANYIGSFKNEVSA